MFTFQNCELLAEGKVLQHQAAATAKSANDGSAPEPKQVKHGSQVIAEGILGYVPMLLNSKVDGIVTRYRWCKSLRPSSLPYISATSWYRSNVPSRRTKYAPAGMEAQEEDRSRSTTSAMRVGSA